MSIKKKIVLLIYILSFVIILCIRVTDAVADANTHKVCVDCHPGEVTDKIVKINELCLKCHPANKTDHPIGVVSKLIPEGLPLDSENKITCITCHEPHGKDTVNKFLRIDPNRLCLLCHRDK